MVPEALQHLIQNIHRLHKSQLLCKQTLKKGQQGDPPTTHLQVPVHHTHLMAVKHRLQDLLDAMTACKHQGGGREGAHVSLSSAIVPCIGKGGVGKEREEREGGGGMVEEEEGM